jgi:N-carbamoyl-L-amino-acid hydrolase
VERAANEFAARHVVGTVGVIQNEPNVMNVIPGRVELRVDFRSSDATARRECTDAICGAIREICSQRDIGIEVNVLADETPVVFSENVVQAIERVCASRNLSAMHLASGAGHDAAHIARVAPSGMIFIPSRGGISHDPREFSSPSEILLGAQVLLGTLVELDHQSE